MTQTTRLFRIFVSSTFADLTAERNILQQKTFPALREYCRKKGVEFQAIDLRWGVSEEASLDQQTMNICLGEIRRCQALTPRPNFLVLLGQRYGWVPPPPQIPENDFEEMSRCWSKEYSQLVETWYRRDDNAVPPAYVLLPRTGTEDWQTIEQQLVSALGQGARSAGWQGSRLLPYCASATHQEIAAGALEVDTPAEKVLCIFRDLEIPAASQNEASVYCDLNTTAIEALRHDLMQALPDENILRVQAAWDAASQAPATTHLQAMADEVYERLRSQIDLELEAPASIVSDEASRGLPASKFLDDEGHQHLAFARKHLEHFVGRTEALAAVEQHLQQHEGRMLVVQGAGGSGKTAFISRALQGIHASHSDAHIMVRFIGTTPDSSGSLALLRSLCRELARSKGEDDTPIDGDYPALSQEFRKRVESFPPPLFLVLDALDQLPAGDPGHTLGWLPQELGPAVRLIVSTRPDETEDLFRYRKTQILALDGLLPSEGQELLEVWFQAASRTLQPRQRAHVLEQFVASDSLPLYLRLAFEEARRWKSWEAPETLAVGIPELLQHNFFDRLASEQHHGRTLVSRTLAYLAASRHGLSESELHDLLSRDVEVYSQFWMGSHHLPADLVDIAYAHARYQNQSISMPEIVEQWQSFRNDPHRLRQALEALFSYRAPSLPVVLLARLRADLEPYLTTRSFDDTLLMGFYHRELADVAANTFLADQAGLIHAHLAKYFERQADPESLRMWLGSKRYLRELPHHLIQAEDWSRLAGDESTLGVLTDLRFIQSKCTAGLTHDLVGDFNRALDLIPGGQDDSTPSAVRLRHFSNFVSHHLGVLSEYPAETLPIAVNYADCGPVVSQAERLLDKSKVPHLRRNPRPPLIPLRSELVMVLEGHKFGSISAMATSDGKRIVSGSMDKTIRVWDITTGQCMRILGGQNSAAVLCVSVSPDGKYIISGYDDKTIRVWDLATGQSIRVLEGHNGWVTSVALTPDGDRIISGSMDIAIRVWDFATGQCLHVLEGHEAAVTSVALTPNGKRVVSGSGDDTIRVWDLATGQSLRVLKGHTDGVACVAVTPDGKQIVSGSWDKTIRVWELATGQSLRVFEGQGESIYCVAVTPDGKRIVSGSNEKTIRVWDLESGLSLRVLKGHNADVNSVTLTPDGKQIISGAWDQTIRLWDLASGQRLRVLEGHSEFISCVVVTPDGKQIISGAWDQTIRLWDLATGQCLRVLEGHGRVESVAVTPNGSCVVSGVGLLTNTIWVWDLASGQCLRVLEGHGSGSIDLAETPNGKSIISGCGDKTVRVWDFATGHCLRVLKGHKAAVTSVAVTPDGKHIVSGSVDDTIRVWDLATGQSLRVLEGHGKSILVVAITPDGKKIIAGSSDNTIRVWDLATGQCLRELKGHNSFVNSVAVTPDGKLIVSKSHDNTIRVWNLATGEKKLLSLLSSPATGIAISPLGDRIVAGTEDGQIHILTPVNFTLCESPMLTEL